MGAIRYFRILPRKAHERVDTLAEALSVRQNGGYAWIDVMDPSEELLSPLVERLGIHPVSVEDCLDEDQVPKIEDFPGNTFILFNRYRYVDSRAVVEEVNFFLGDRFLVTVHSHKPGSGTSGEHGNRTSGERDGNATSGKRDENATSGKRDGNGAPREHGNGTPGERDGTGTFAERLERLLGRNAEMIREGPEFFLQVILDDIVDEKFVAIESLQDELDTLEEEVLRGEAGFRLEKLTYLRRSLLLIRKSLVYEREILVGICRRDSPFIDEKAIYHFRDIYDHLSKFFEVIEICRDIIATLMEIHLAAINNRIALVGNRTNLVVRRLTLITTVFMPLTLLAGIGGMSEWSMMTGPRNWRFAYPAFMLLMALIGAASYAVLRRLEARDDLS